MQKFKVQVSVVLSIIILSVFFQCQFKPELPAKVVEIIDAVKTQYHPDNRISVFDVNARQKKNKLILSGEILSAVAKAELMSRLKSETQLEILDSLILLPTSEIGENKFGIVRISVAQMRRQPDVDQEIISQELMGNEVKILKKHGWWYFVQAEDDYLGWMMKGSVITGDSVFVREWRQKQNLIVTSNYGQIWEKPDEKCRRSVSDVVLRNKLFGSSQSNGWRQVELPDGRNGFLKSNLVTELSKFEKLQLPVAGKMVELAYTFVGIPYFWGGKSTKCFDCSGFTQTIYKMHGIQLPRDANMQVKAGREVEIDEELKNLQPADLLFFGRSIDRITHVAMYIGNSQFIHSDGLVHVNSFDPDHENFSEYRRKGLRAVRRILK